MATGFAAGLELMTTEGGGGGGGDQLKSIFFSYISLMIKFLHILRKANIS